MVSLIGKPHVNLFTDNFGLLLNITIRLRPTNIPIEGGLVEVLPVATLL